MTPDEARALKKRGRWGLQDGLLSVAELVHLSQIASGYDRVLEVGHYHGLSTACLAGDGRLVVTVDSHAGDSWVPDPAGCAAFLENHRGNRRVVPMFIDSRALVAPLQFPFVFYDGDHAAEQERFTDAVLGSNAIKQFAFDDRDFPHPTRCCEMLRDAGWIDESPPCVRGKKDKLSEETMTLAVFCRP